jgi:uncharacterized repeat protein (TIGR03803 family)
MTMSAAVRRAVLRAGLLASSLLLIALPAGHAALAGPQQVIHSFGDGDGEYPQTDLVRDAAGNLYGMSVQGGQFGAGTVFRISPAGSGWTETVLYSFTGGADGGQPYGGVTLDAAGNIYGTGVIGGTGGVCAEDGCGVTFKLTNTGSGFTQSVIHHFAGPDGSGPGGPVVFDNAGNLYGMTPTGGTDGLGVIYQLVPGPGGTWTQNVIHNFTGGADGGTGSAGRLLLDPNGNFYGVATVGGLYGQGIVFHLTSDSGTPSGPWTLRPIYDFKGSPDASFPYGGLIFDKHGNLYGTTYYGGTDGLGAVYKLDKRSGVWVESVLHSFTGGSDGANPISHLVLGPKGRMYGTTSEGGSSCGCGTIFKMTQKANGLWQESIVYRFEGAPDGSYAYNGLTVDPAGNLYGSTVHGGDDDDGSVYQFKP